MGRRNGINAPRYRRLLEGVGEMGSMRHDIGECSRSLRHDNYRRVLEGVGETGSMRHDNYRRVLEGVGEMGSLRHDIGESWSEEAGKAGGAVPLPRLSVDMDLH